MTKWPRPKEIHSSALPVRVMLSVRPWPCQVPANVASVALSPPQPSSTKIVIAAAGSAAIRGHVTFSPAATYSFPRHTRPALVTVKPHDHRPHPTMHRHKFIAAISRKYALS